MSFDYSNPSTLSEAVAQLGKLGVDARPLGGGTDIMLNARHHALKAKHLVSLKTIPNLAYLKVDDDGSLRLGGMTTLREIEKSTLVKRMLPVLSEAASQVGSVQIRNVATLAGNLCQSVKCPYYNLSHISLFMRRSLADCCQRGGKVCLALKADSVYHSILGKAVDGCIAPAPSDMAVPLMAADAELSALSVKGERRIRLDEFYVGAGKTKLASDEIITEIRVPANGRRVGFVYKKYATSPRDVAVSNAAVRIELDHSSSTCAKASIVLGGVAPAPIKAAEAEQYLTGQRPTGEVLDECSRKALEGARTPGPKTFFKLRKTTVMLREALWEAFRAAKEAS